MKFTTSRSTLLKPIQSVIGVVERRQTMPILANVLLVVRGQELAVTATDLEVELVARIPVDKVDSAGEVTVPGRKLLDICRALPDDANVQVHLDGDRLVIKSGRSRFVLGTLPAAEFPVVDDVEGVQSLELGQQDLRKLLEKTHFAMAQQDVRYYLNGLLLETGKKMVRAVATDGHRLALCELTLEAGGGKAKAGARPTATRSLFRERACRSFSVCWWAMALWFWLSELITFAPRSATFASLRSLLTVVSRIMSG